MKITVTELVKSIPERLGLELDVSTPQKAYDFLNDVDFPVFYISGNSRDLGSYIYSTEYVDWEVKCGHKAMYIFNDLFSPETDINNEKYLKYGIAYNETKISDLIDYEDNIGYYSDISFYEKENTQYIAILSGGFIDFKSVLNACAKICKETNDYITFTCYTITNEKIGYEISTEGVISKIGKYIVKDDNADCFAGDLSVFITLFGCKTFEDMEEICIPYEVEICEQKQIDVNSGIFYLYENKEEIKMLTNIDEAVEIVLQFPMILKYFPKEIQLDKKIALAFIEANEPYMSEYNKIFEKNCAFVNGDWIRLGSLIDGAAAKLNINGEVPCGWELHHISDEIIKDWCLNQEIFEKLLHSSMYRWCILSEELFKKLDHIALFEKEAKYAFILRQYYINREDKLDDDTRSKEERHIRRKYRLSDDVPVENIILLKTIETIGGICNNTLKILSHAFDFQEVVAIAKDLLESLPLEDRDELIMDNIRFAYPIRNTLSNDDKIVKYICEMCCCAGYFLSDEIVEIRNLKRTSLDITKVCKECHFC